MDAASEGPGKGSRFEVRLPLAAPAEVAAADASPAQPVAPRGMRVMIADDNRDAADSLCRLLALYGYEARGGSQKPARRVGRAAFHPPPTTAARRSR